MERIKMTNIEYRKFKAHIYMYLDPKELSEELKKYKKLPESNGTLWGAVDTMCQHELFDIHYEQVLNTLRDVYGNDFDESKYVTKDREYRYKNGEVYCWKTYKAKIAKTIELMEKKGEL